MPTSTDKTPRYLTIPDAVSRSDVEAVIEKVDYIHPQGTCLTICLITCFNGYVATGESGCADPKNFNLEKGKLYSFEQAFAKVWAAEGYLLRQRKMIARAYQLKGLQTSVHEIPVPGYPSSMIQVDSFGHAGTISLPEGSSEELIKALNAAARDPSAS